MVAQSLYQLGLVVSKRGNPDEAQRLLSDSLALARKLPANDYVDPKAVAADLVKVLTAEGKQAEAESIAKEAATNLSGIK